MVRRIIRIADAGWQYRRIPDRSNRDAKDLLLHGLECVWVRHKFICTRDAAVNRAASFSRGEALRVPGVIGTVFNSSLALIPNAFASRAGISFSRMKRNIRAAL